MVKAYLSFEPATAFGVITSSSAAAVSLACSGRAAMVACPAVDAVVIWNVRSSTASARLANRDTRRAGPVTALALAPNGTTLAAGYSDGSIRLWDVAAALNAASAASALASEERSDGDLEAEPLMTFNGHRSAISALSFLRTPQQPLSADAAPKERERKAGPDKSQPFHASISGTSHSSPTRLASGSNDGDVIAWDLVGETGLFRLMAHNDAVTALVMLDRPDGALIICSSKDGLVRIYNAESQHCVQTIVGHHSEVWDLDVDPSHRLLVTGSVDADLRMFAFKGYSKFGAAQSDPSDNKSTDDGLDSEAVLVDIGAVRRSNAAGRVMHIAIHSVQDQNFLVVSAADKSCELFRLRSGVEAERHRKRRRQRLLEKLRRAAESSNAEDGSGQVADDEMKDLSEDGVVAKDYLVSVRSFKASSRVRSVIFASSLQSQSVQEKQAALRSTTPRTFDVRLIMQFNNNALEVHSIRVAAKRKKVRKKQKHRGVESVSPNVVQNGQETDGVPEPVDEYEEDLGAMERVSTVNRPGHRGDIRAVVLSPDDSSMLSISRKSAKLWNVASGRCIRTVETSGSNLCAKFLSADARFAAVGSMEGALEVLDLSSGEVSSCLSSAHSDSVWSMTLDERVFDATYIVTGAADKLVKVWDFSQIGSPGGDPKLLRTLELPDEVLDVCVAYGREDPILVVALMDSTVRGFKLSTFEPYMSFYGHKMPVLSLDVSSDGLLLATGSADKTVKLWGMDFGDCRRSLRAHEDSVQCVAFQPGTHYLFSGGRDGKLKYWDCDKFEYISALDGQRGHVWSIAVGEDGEFVASGGRDRLLRVWRRTDEQLFLEEEQDRRLDDMFESTLIDEDNKEAHKARSKVVGFMFDPSKGESLPAGKRSLETVKAGEKLLEALQLGEAERRRVLEDDGDSPNPMLLGLSADAYVLRALEQIRSPDLDEALSLLPLDQANIMLSYCDRLLAPTYQGSQLAVELLCRVVLYLFKVHHNQILAGAVDRQLVASLREAVDRALNELRDRFGFNASALSFWQQELADRDDATFRDASARAFNLHKAQERRTKRARV